MRDVGVVAYKCEIELWVCDCVTHSFPRVCKKYRVVMHRPQHLLRVSPTLAECRIGPNTCYVYPQHLLIVALAPTLVACVPQHLLIVALVPTLAACVPQHLLITTPRTNQHRPPLAIDQRLLTIHQHLLNVALSPTLDTAPSRFYLCAQLCSHPQRPPHQRKSKNTLQHHAPHTTCFHLLFRPFFLLCGNAEHRIYRQYYGTPCFRGTCYISPAQDQTHSLTLEPFARSVNPKSAHRSKDCFT